MQKTILQESEQGVIYRYNKVPNDMFNFYILKKQTFKDGTHKWHLCVELAAAQGDKYIVIDSIRGKKGDAIKRLDELIKNSGRVN